VTTGRAMYGNYRPEQVERAILEAINLLALESRVPDQIADLSDAIAAYRAGTYGVAMALARVASHPLRSSSGFRNDEGMTNSLDDLHAEFLAARAERISLLLPVELQPGGGSGKAINRHDR